MVNYILAGWVLGIVTAHAVAFLLFAVMNISESRRNTPPTKDEWKVM